jgi:hypothetical protein
MSRSIDPTEAVLFDEEGVIITDSHVRTQKLECPLSGSAFTRTRTSECVEVDAAETARLRRRLLPWGAGVALLLCTAAAWGWADVVQAQFYLSGGREPGLWLGRGIAFAIVAVFAALGLGGALLCARVQRKYRLHHVYLDTRAGRREIARSRNADRIQAIATALDKAIARLSVASTEPPIPGSASPHPSGTPQSFAAS